ncbi:PTS fructose transporter subunit IIC [Clostridium sp. MSJ-4]|uniref:PTS fructose transporter subunit IIC n=1 Tax=Clostridium simiarum TaxID=2841506 RepID=A0ABS6F103_9CLOT|nr:PTS fructose transporter subunit IIC [Clostridium amazonitimonense]MBU5591590.1 PTS fructose transporter subunit IIC [Clostridium simiarum]
MQKTKSVLKEIQKAFLSGVSFMMPAVVAGGLMLAISLATGEKTGGALKITNAFMLNINVLGKAAFAMMIPILAGYIAYSIAGKPGLAPGMIMGYIANNPVGENGAKSGFLGAMLLGVVVGYLVKWIKGFKVPKTVKTIMPILIIPTVSVFVVGVVYIYIIAEPLASLMNFLTVFLGNMNGTNKILLAICIGCMNAFDMGGPVTKSVSMFTLALMNEGIYEPNGMFRITVAIPPIGIFLATRLFKNKFNQGERDAGLAAGIMGCIGITEGAIPFAVSDFKRVIPSGMVGAAVGAIIGAIAGVKCYVPHGGFVVLPVVENKLWFVIAIIAGSLVTALMLGLLKPNIEKADN